MPPNVETMFSVREVPWHGQGVILEEPPRNIQEALQVSGLDWEVEKTGLYVVANGYNVITGSSYSKVDDYYAIRRTDSGMVLGVVGDRYEPLQNIEAFQFLDNLIGSEMHFETAGSINMGRKVWVLANLPDHIEVGGDLVNCYILISNGHDGKNAVQVLITPIRVVCQNTLSLAISMAKRAFALRHTGDPTAKLHEARQTLDLTINYYGQFKQVGDKLALVKIKQDKVLDILIETLYPNGVVDTDRAKNNAESAKLAVAHIMQSVTVGNSPGTKWAGLNAICEFLDWERPTRGDSDRFARINYEATNPKQKAYDLIVAA